METLDLAEARITLEVRPAYVLVTERGTLSSDDAVARYAAAVQSRAAEHGLRSVLVDARAAVDGHEERAKLAERWQRARCFDRIAWVMPASSEIAGVQARMQSLSRGIVIRTFATQQDAHRWLLTKVRGFSGTMPAIEAVRPPKIVAPTTAPRAPAQAPTPRDGMRPPSAGSVDLTNVVARPGRDDAGAPPQEKRAGARPSTPLAVVRPSQRLMKAVPAAPAAAPPPPAPATAPTAPTAPSRSGVQHRGAVKELIERSGTEDEDPR